MVNHHPACSCFSLLYAQAVVFNQCRQTAGKAAADRLELPVALMTIELAEHNRRFCRKSSPRS